jgi:hypothetical protein
MATDKVRALDFFVECALFGRIVNVVPLIHVHPLIIVFY